MPEAVIRTDASPEIGGGHVMRCLSLAGALKERGWTCTFVSVRGSSDTVPALKEGLHGLVEVSAGDALSVAPLQDLAGVDLLVVDHYGLDAAFESAARDHAGHVLVIDDLADRPHDCDVLLDQTLGRPAGDYAALVPRNCTFLLGPEHALLRPAFAQLRATSIARRGDRLDRVFVSFGASDPLGYCEPAAKAARDAGAKHVDIAVGTSCPHLDALRASSERHTEIHLHENADVAPLMAQADIAIGAAGGTSWERCCLGLPALIVITADNQEMNAKRLETNGAAISIRAERVTAGSPIAEALADIAREPSRLSTMSQAAAAICDGMGAHRTIDAVVALTSSSGSPPALAV